MDVDPIQKQIAATSSPICASLKFLKGSISSRQNFVLAICTLCVAVEMVTE